MCRENSLEAKEYKIKVKTDMKDTEENHTHYLTWDESKIAHFWNYVAQSEAHQADYFAKQVGSGVVKFLRCVVPLEGRILDYGCGPGYLSEHLVRYGIRCEGCDVSKNSVDAVNERFKGNDLWGGAKLSGEERLPYPDDTFDLIICVEIIEHVLDIHMKGILQELHRILKPQTGRLFITTPNNENLALSEAYCPECGAVFHRYQHLSSFTTGSLDRLMVAHGFRTELCNVTLFNSFQEPFIKHPLDWSPRYLVDLSKKLSIVLLDLIGSPNAPIGGYRFNQQISKGCHLFWLGAK